MKITIAISTGITGDPAGAGGPGRPAGPPALRQRLTRRPERHRLGQVAEQALQVDPGPGRVRGLHAGVVLVLVEPAGGVMVAERGDRLLPLGVPDPEQVRGQRVRTGFRKCVGHRVAPR